MPSAPRPPHRGALGSVADDHQRPVESRALDDVDEVRRALVRRELAEVQRVRARHRRRPMRRRRARSAATFTGFGMTSRRCRASSGARARRSRGDGRADGDDRVAPRASPRRLRARLRAHVGNHRQRQRPQRAGARPDAPRHHPRRTAGHSDGLVGRVNEIGPVADRPVVAHRADGRDAGARAASIDGRQVSTCCPWTSRCARAR